MNCLWPPLKWPFAESEVKKAETTRLYHLEYFMIADKDYSMTADKDDSMTADKDDLQSIDGWLNGCMDPLNPLDSTHKLNNQKKKT